MFETDGEDKYSFVALKGKCHAYTWCAWVDSRKMCQVNEHHKVWNLKRQTNSAIRNKPMQIQRFRWTYTFCDSLCLSPWGLQFWIWIKRHQSCTRILQCRDFMLLSLTFSVMHDIDCWLGWSIKPEWVDWHCLQVLAELSHRSQQAVTEVFEETKDMAKVAAQTLEAHFHTKND